MYGPLTNRTYIVCPTWLICFFNWTETTHSVSTEKLPTSESDTIEVLSDPGTPEKERKHVFEGTYIITHSCLSMTDSWSG